MRRKDIRKRKGIRYAEYYNMVEIQDELYRQGMMKKKFYHLMPIIASPQNIRLAYRNLKNNKGSNTPGVDGKTFADYAKLEDVELIRKVQEKLLNYQPKAVRRVYIPKSNGKLRPLGIPTVLDRLVQQSILQVLEPVCESKFHRYSYGFRPNRSCKQAVAMCYKLAQVNGYHYVVDVDIKGFFDHVNHGKLLKQLWSLGIRDKSLLCVISRMLKAPVEENGKRTIPQEGTLKAVFSAHCLRTSYSMNLIGGYIANGLAYQSTTHLQVKYGVPGLMGCSTVRVEIRNSNGAI